MGKPLEAGDELRCPHCRRWHPVAATNSAGTEYTRLMMFWECRELRYYAGQIGTLSRHDTRSGLNVALTELPRGNVRGNRADHA